MKSPKHDPGDLGRAGHGARCDRAAGPGHGGRADRAAVTDPAAARRRTAPYERSVDDRPPRGASSTSTFRPRRPASRRLEDRTWRRILLELSHVVRTGLVAVAVRGGSVRRLP